MSCAHFSDTRIFFFIFNRGGDAEMTDSIEAEGEQVRSACGSLVMWVAR